MKISKSFDVREFVPPEIYKEFGENSTWFVDQDTVKMAQFIRDYFGKPMTINNWFTGGPYTERGYRLPDSKTGAKLGQHRLCKAIDFTIEGLSPDKIRSSILADSKTFLRAGITTIEDGFFTPTWTHVDRRWTMLDFILIVRPANSSDVNALSVQDSDLYFKYEKGELTPYNFCL